MLMKTQSPVPEKKKHLPRKKNLEKDYPSERSINSAVARATDGHSSAVIKRIRVCVDPTTGAVCPIGAQKKMDSEGSYTDESICPYFTNTDTACAIGEDAYVEILKQMRQELNPLTKAKDLFWERRYDALLAREFEVATKGVPGKATLMFRQQELDALKVVEELTSKKEGTLDAATQLSLLRKTTAPNGDVIIDKATRTIIPAKAGKGEEKKEEVIEGIMSEEKKDANA